MEDETTTSTPEARPRGRGRPKGSRNKPRAARLTRHAARASAPTHATPRQRGRTMLDEQPGGLIAQTRGKLVHMDAACPTCGHVTSNYTQQAKEMGISTMTLRKFRNGGSVSAEALERIFTYVNDR